MCVIFGKAGLNSGFVSVDKLMVIVMGIEPDMTLLAGIKIEYPFVQRFYYDKVIGKISPRCGSCVRNVCVIL